MTIKTEQLEARAVALGLDFLIEDRSGIPIKQRIPDTEGCTPATDAEVTMWELLAARKVVPDDYAHLKNVQELYHKQEDRLFAIAQRIHGKTLDKYSHSVMHVIDVLERDIFGTLNAAAARGAVPVYQMRLLDGSQEQNIWVEVTHDEFNTPLKNPDKWEKRVLYTVPPAPAMPEAFKALIEHLSNAHAFIENTEAFGHAAANGIIQCGDAVWNIDESKAALEACRSSMQENEKGAGE